MKSDMKRIWIAVILSLMCLALNGQSNMSLGAKYYKEGTSNYNPDAENDMKRALPYLQAAAKEGYGEACYYLGDMYENGLGVSADYEIARRMYEKAIEFGYERGEAELGDMYMYGKGVDVDFRKAYDLFCQGSKRGSIGTDCRVAMFYWYKDLAEAVGLKKDNAKAYELIRNKFDEARFCGDSNVYLMAAYYCIDCNGLEPNTRKNGNELACNFFYEGGLGVMLVNFMLDKKIDGFYVSRPGSSFRCSLHDAIKLALKNPLPTVEAARLLYVYATGQDKRLDSEKQLEEFERKGRLEGTYYKNNYGYNLYEALEKAAQYGYGPAQKLMGDVLSRGNLVSKNLIKAKEWYAMAKASGETVPEL